MNSIWQKDQFSIDLTRPENIIFQLKLTEMFWHMIYQNEHFKETIEKLANVLVGICA